MTRCQQGTLIDCPVCGGTRFVALFYKNGQRFVRCDDCSLVLINPQPAAEALNAIYEASYSSRYIHKRARKLWRARRRVRQLARYRLFFRFRDGGRPRCRIRRLRQRRRQHRPRIRARGIRHREPESWLLRRRRLSRWSFRRRDTLRRYCARAGSEQDCRRARQNPCSRRHHGDLDTGCPPVAPTETPRELERHHAFEAPILLFYRHLQRARGPLQSRHR